MADDSRDWKKFGRYALLQKIGSGGMAEIYRAKTFGAAGFEKEFAIKLILPSLVDDSEFVEMFINEAKLAVNLYHANIVQVFDLGELNEQYYIAMEYVHGKDLLDVLARCAEMNIKIPLDLVLFIAMEMLKGLDFAHRATDPYGEPLNIIHRDVSPSNIMISYAGDVKVGDFGVAKAEVQRTLTQTGTLKGKVGYMSPEQVMGDEIDARSDLFAAGIVLFEALSMSRLFVGDSDLDVMTKVRDADVEENLRQAQPLPGDLVEILEKALTKHREERFQTAEDFYQALVDFCFRHSIKVTGADLSSFMRRLFAEEIEEEKKQRRSEPSGEALSQEMARVEREQQPGNQIHGFGNQHQSPPPEDRAGDSQPEPSPETPSARALRDTATVDEPDGESDDQRRGPPDRQVVNGENGEADEPEDEGRYRYRDDSGLIFGPMGEDTLHDLLRVRNPGRDDQISVDGGDWKPIGEVEKLDVGDFREGSADPDRTPERVQREVSVEPDVSSGTEAEDGDAARAAASGASPDVGGDVDVEDSPGLAGVLKKPGQDEDDESAGDRSGPDEGDETASPADTIQDPGAGVVDPGGADPSDTLRDPEAGTVAADSTPGVGADSEPSETLQELKDQYASYEGDFTEVSIARLLGRLHLAGETGRLFVHRNGVEKSIFFRNGEPVFIDSNREEELLGRFLRSRDVITEEELEQALDRLDEWGGRLGDALVAIGAIPAHGLFEHLSAQMREKLLEIFTWEHGNYGYYEGQEPDTQGYSLDLDTYDTIVEGCREWVDVDLIREFYENRMFVSIYRSSPAPFEPDRLGLEAREMRVLNSIVSGTSLEDLLSDFPEDDHERVFRTVYLLHQVEILSFEVTARVDLPPLPHEDEEE